VGASEEGFLEPPQIGRSPGPCYAHDPMIILQSTPVDPWGNAKAVAETFKNWSEAFAWLCAGGFFLYKAFSGYLISNLSLSLICNRERSTQETYGTDYLVVTANLRKGERGAVTLHDVRARVSPTVHGEPDSKVLAGIRRLTSNKTGLDVFQLGSAEASEKPLLNLPPGEETMFSGWFRVPSAEPCTIEVTVLGGWRWHRRGTRYQWRASVVSLPIVDK